METLHTTKESFFERSGAIVITLREFCKKTGIGPHSWIFQNLSEKSRFFMYKRVHNRVVDEPDKYFYNDGKVIREFKYMQEYDEVWMRVYDMTKERPEWGLWGTFKEC